MNIKKWTGEEIRNRFPSATSLGEVIDELSRSMTLDGEVLCEVRVNDLLLTEEEESRFKSTPVADIHQLDVKASTPTGLLDESLAGCQEYLSRLAIAFENTADLFRKENMDKAHEFYRSCINGSDWFVQLLTHYKVVHQSIRGELPIDWLAAEIKLMEALNQVLTAYEKKDFILLADLLEYEITSVLNMWREQLDILGYNDRTNQETQSIIR